MPNEAINIAIDGPAGAGKSTVAKLAAKQLNMVYVDTGAMYRALTWKVLSEQIQPQQTDQVISVTKRTRIQLEHTSDGQKVFVDGLDVTEDIRTNQVSKHVSFVARIPEVRNWLTSIQKSMTKRKGVIMDGRDIGTHVIPEAELKIFLTASVEERAKRRYDELKAKQQEVSLEQLIHEISERDQMDADREVAPLRQAEDAVAIDTTGLSLEEVVERIVTLAKSRMQRAIES